MDGHPGGYLRKLVDSMMMSWIDATGVKITPGGALAVALGAESLRGQLCRHRRSGGAGSPEKRTFSTSTPHRSCTIFGAPGVLTSLVSKGPASAAPTAQRVRCKSRSWTRVPQPGPTSVRTPTYYAAGRWWRAVKPNDKYNDDRGDAE
jgi:hypothetical protein